jgi:uncharacterized protein with HEPN domain
MLQYCNHVLAFTSVTNLESLREDLKTQFAVIRALEVLGEAAKRILDTPSGADPRLNALPLKKMYATRNRFTHGYETLNLDTLWEISQNDIPKLKQDLESLLSSWPADLS